MAERSGKTAYPKIGAWFDEVAGDEGKPHPAIIEDWKNA